MTELPALNQLLRDTRVRANHHPWPRRQVTAAHWHELTRGLALQRWTLSGLWGDAGNVHLALREASTGDIAVTSLACPDGCYPSISARHLPALRLERSLADLYGLVPVGLPDPRPWLDHGCWPERHPLSANPQQPPPAAPYPFLPAAGEGLHQIPVGPVHAGIIEPGHFRFHAAGETVVRLEQRLGYVHRGVEQRLGAATIAHGARLAGRLSGDSTVAYALAYSRAVEAALDLAMPARAHWLRALMAELERLANHLGDIGAICNDAAFPLLQAHFGLLRERVLQTAAGCWGHRLMMDRVVPGGVAADLTDAGQARLTALVTATGAALPELIRLYDQTASLQDRTVGTGRTDPALVRRYGAGGFIGRAAGSDFDTRREIGYPPYPELAFEVPVLTAGDVNARVWIRIREVEQSLNLIAQILERLPAGPHHIAVPPVPADGAEGMALVEGFRGDILAWLRLTGDGRIDRCHLRDPSWFQWPLLEAAIDGNIVADFPLCNKSFNCCYAGVDL